MIIDVSKKETSEEFCAEGGASVQIVNKTTVPLGTSIHEAKEALLVVGDELLVLAQFQGLVKSMALGVARDGHARQIGEFLTIYAVPKGPIDLERGWDPAVNSILLKARLLGEMEIDITNWVFRDVTPGRVAFRLNSASTGADNAVVDVGREVHLNGSDLPAEKRVEWSVEGTEASGSVPAEKVSGDCDRIDLAPDALNELISSAYEGKVIVFTVRGNKTKSSVKATLHIPPAPPAITRMITPTPNEVNVPEDEVVLECTGAADVTVAEVGKVVNGAFTAFGTYDVTYADGKLTGTPPCMDNVPYPVEDTQIRITTAGGSALSPKFLLTNH